MYTSVYITEQSKSLSILSDHKDKLFTIVNILDKSKYACIVHEL